MPFQEASHTPSFGGLGLRRAVEVLGYTLESATSKLLAYPEML